MLLATLCGFAAWLCTAIVLGSLRFDKQAGRQKVLRLHGEKEEKQICRKVKVRRRTNKDKTSFVISQTSSTRPLSLETMYWNLGSVASSGTCSPGSWCRLKSSGGSFNFGKA